MNFGLLLIHLNQDHNFRWWAFLNIHVNRSPYDILLQNKTCAKRTNKIHRTRIVPKWSCNLYGKPGYGRNPCRHQVEEIEMITYRGDLQWRSHIIHELPATVGLPQHVLYRSFSLIVQMMLPKIQDGGCSLP